MKVLVFGGSGWVGHKIVQQFVAAGHSVTSCTRGKDQAFADELAPIPTFQADKNNRSDLQVMRDARNHRKPLKNKGFLYVNFANLVLDYKGFRILYTK